MQGDKRIDKLMLPVLNAINRHVKDRDAKTDIYNRAYEAVMISMVVKTSTTGVKTPESIENTNPDYYKQEIARRDKIITRLKEDAERLANSDYRLPSGVTKCPYCSKADWTIRPDGKSTEIHHAPDCPITLHRALMKELEER